MDTKAPRRHSLSHHSDETLRAMADLSKAMHRGSVRMLDDLGIAIPSGVLDPDDVRKLAFMALRQEMVGRSEEVGRG